MAETVHGERGGLPEVEGRVHRRILEHLNKLQPGQPYLFTFKKPGTYAFR